MVLSFEKLIEQFEKGNIDSQYLKGELSKLYSYSSTGVAKVDHYREERTGIKEFVYGQDKSKKQLLSITKNYLSHKKNILITKLTEDKIKYLRKEEPKLHFNTRCAMMWYRFTVIQKTEVVPVVCAGTSDIPIAVEARITLGFLGYRSIMISDIGVSALHRLFQHRESLMNYKIIICIAGLEASLPTVVGGFTGKPIVAVPSSVGYGVSKGGMPALFSLLSSCSPNVSTQNIDNGFGAACFCSTILRSFE